MAQARRKFSEAVKAHGKKKRTDKAHQGLALIRKLYRVEKRARTVGRKNWLFSASVKGVKASANLYSLIETAKANGLESYANLRYLFAELPRAETVVVIEALLPGNIDKDQIRSG
jgi:hypothetical protein